MIHRAAVFLFLLGATIRVCADYHPKPEETWPLVATAKVIVTGSLSVPVEEIRKCQASTKHAHVNLTVKRDQVLKGSVPEEFTVKWFTRPAHHSPDPERVMQLDGQKVMLFLTLLGDEPGREFYFAGSSPQALTEPGEPLQKQVRSEILLQQKVLGAIEKSIPPVDHALLGKVGKLIDATTRKDTQTDAFRQLEALGWDGVPAMILLMDDRRDLAVPHIELENQPGHFEGIRQYGPRQVVDAVAAILNQITAENFGFIYSGDVTEEDRMEAVAGWGMYLYHWKKSEGVPSPAQPWKEHAAAIGEAADFRNSAMAAEKLMIYEGLPHPGTKRELARREMQRKDVIEIGGHSFYTPAVPAKDPDGLKKLLGDPKSTKLYGGAKLCGGFHPDYAIVWESGGKTFHALVCFGCHEVCFLEGTRKILYDLGEGAWASLSDYVLKHPGK
jgi:hypothetical protein